MLREIQSKSHEGFTLKSESELLVIPTRLHSEPRERFTPNFETDESKISRRIPSEPLEKGHVSSLGRNSYQIPRKITLNPGRALLRMSSNSYSESRKRFTLNIEKDSLRVPRGFYFESRERFTPILGMEPHGFFSESRVKFTLNSQK